MKMMCPHCGLGGTADTSQYGRKVRCPECRAVFRVSDEVIVDFPPAGAVEQSIMQHNQEQELDVVDVENPGILDSDLTDSTTGLEDQNLGECSRCGFSFSREFLKIVDDLPVCPVCAG